MFTVEILLVTEVLQSEKKTLMHVHYKHLPQSLEQGHWDWN